MKKLLVGSMLILISAACLAGDLPDPHLTPGATNPDVTQSNLQTTVCKRGYSKSIRPPAYFTNSLKKRQIGQYGYTDRNPTHYEEDHLIALSLGGNPTDERNLWPEPRNSQWGADKKDRLEFVLFRMICTNEIPLIQAQHEMATNWIAAFNQYVPSHPALRYRGNGD